MKKNNTKKLAFLLSALFFAGNEISFAKPVSNLDAKNNPSTSSVVGKENVAGKNHKLAKHENKKAKVVTIKSEAGNSYQPYVQFGGTRFFHVEESKAAATADLFIPLWQHDLPI